MRLTHVFLPLILLSPCAFGATTICQFDGSGHLPSVVSWDSVTHQAKAEFNTYGTKSGKLTLSRKHGDYSNKVNLVFPPSSPLFGDEFEIIVFPVGRNAFRALGVAYVISDGSKHLSISLGDADAVCNSL